MPSLQGLGRNLGQMGSSLSSGYSGWGLVIGIIVIKVTGCWQSHLILNPAGTLGRAEETLAHFSFISPREGSRATYKHMEVIILRIVIIMGTRFLYSQNSWNGVRTGARNGSLPFPNYCMVACHSGCVLQSLVPSYLSSLFQSHWVGAARP